jgi:hypothetical protein
VALFAGFILSEDGSKKAEMIIVTARIQAKIKNAHANPAAL